MLILLHLSLETCVNGEVFVRCGNRCAMDYNCDDYHLPRPCARICEPGCYCPDSQVRDANGKCIPREQCPNKCKEFEILVACANPCEPSCDEPNREPCPTYDCIQGCACKEGYLRNKDGECVKPDSCPG